MSDKRKKAAAIAKENARKKYKKNMYLAAAAAAAIIVVIVIMMFTGCKQKEEGEYTDADFQAVLDSFETIEPIQVVEPTGDVVVTQYPAATPFFEKIGTLDPEEMKPVASSGLTFPYVVPEMDLTIMMIDGYSGPYIEDGSNEYVENCVAILIKNTGDEVLEYGQLSFRINEDEEAMFKISTLPAGACAVVLEANKKEFKNDDIFMVTEKGLSTVESLPLNIDKVRVTGGEKELTVKNITGTKISKAVVCYKNLYMEGLYFGGITYARTFENIEAGAELKLNAENYYPEACEILKVDVYE